MSITVEVTISEDLLSDVPSSSDDDVPKPDLLQSWAAAAYLKEIPAITSMLVTTESEIQKLNKQYRDKDKPTNVLSFPMDSPAEIDICLLGDIALCAQVIKQEAIQQCKTNDAHWAHMVVHGMLHLQGFDHVQDDDAETMEQLEIKILSTLGFSNPYESLR